MTRKKAEKTSQTKLRATSSQGSVIALSVESIPQSVTIKKKIVHAAQKLRKDRATYHTSAALPWRTLRTPYRIFLAEFLLVRTRADIVARLFESVFEKYPDMHSLARANEQELALALEPLGLRKRVPLLLRGASYIVEKHKGQVPETVQELLKVPGLGAYSAVAIAAFAYGRSEVPADVNILRFLSRLTGFPMTHQTKGSKELWSMLPLLSPDVGGPSPEKLLDFSRLVCRPGPPRCELCPVFDKCAFFASSRLGRSSS